MQSDRGVAARDPGVAAKRTLHGYFTRVVALRTGNMIPPRRHCQTTLQSVRGAHGHDPRDWPEVHF
eukprot:1180574-Pyramimonas_sp.AAC.1